MKTVVALQDLVDLEIRPGDLAEQFRELTKAGVEVMASGVLTEVPCPACRSHSAEPAYVVFGLTYRECQACETLFVSPRPSETVLAEWAQTSPAATFWRERILGGTMPARRAKLLQPRADWVADGVSEHRATAARGLDLQSGTTGMGDELAGRLRRDVTLSAADVHGDWSASNLDFVTAFDVLDRAFDVPGLVARIADALLPGGLLFLTAPNRNGFDIETLGDQAPVLTPPDKLNVLSLAGFQRLFSAPDWQIIELSTPGMFDVETVRQSILRAPDGKWPRVIRSLTVDADATARLELQEYLQRHRRASFARLLVRRVDPSQERR